MCAVMLDREEERVQWSMKTSEGRETCLRERMNSKREVQSRAPSFTNNGMQVKLVNQRGLNEGLQFGGHFGGKGAREQVFIPRRKVEEVDGSDLAVLCLARGRSVTATLG